MPDPLSPQDDPFHPPEVPTEVSCLHCGKRYESYLIEWRVETDAEGKQQGFWCCPTPGCGGMGFGFDIFPTDPTYRDERGGWFCDEEDDEEDDPEFDEEDLDGESYLSDDFSPGGSSNGNGVSHEPDADDGQIPF